MRLLVTGGAGFIGSHYVRTLLSGGYPELPDAEVTVLDMLSYAGDRANLAPVAGDPRLRLVVGDVADAPLVDTLLPGVDAVVHFAAESHVDRAIARATPFTTTNVLGTQVLLDAATRHRVARFVQVSTDEVYGSVSAGAATEERALAPSNPYAASKAAADLMALAYHHTHGLPAIVTRGPNTYGPYQFPEKVVPLFVTNLLSGRPLPLYGDGAHTRSWLHVDDHCRGVQRALTDGAPGEVYHVGGGTPLSNRELTGRLLAAFGVGWEVVRQVPDRKGHDRRYCLDGTKLAELGYTPRVGFDAGLAETVAWYRDNPGWWKAARERAPLPPS